MEIRILIGLCFALFFLGNWLLPVTDPTENCYALTVKEMLEAGDWFSPRIYGNYWYDKPIFFYWELLLSCKIFGVNEFALRFPSAVMATACVALTYFCAKLLLNKKSAFCSAVILCCSVEFWYVAHAIITDMTLVFFISAALFAFYFGYTKKKTALYDLAWAAAAFAVLTKGPIGFCLPALIIFIFLCAESRLSHLVALFRARGIAIFLLIAASWYLPMYIIHGADFIYQFFGVHNFLRATVSEHPIFNVWYYYIIVFFIGMFPFSIAAFFHFKPIYSTFNRFLIIWAAAVFVIFQLAATKYPTYTFPYIVPLAIIFAQIIPYRRIINLAAAMFIFLLIANFAAIPIIARNSAREAAQIISPIADNACIVSYRRFYPGSFVFYSGLKCYRLESDADIAKLRPNNFSWTAVNVMPFTTFQELKQRKKIIAMVDNAKLDKFIKLTGGDWRIISEYADYKILISGDFF